MRNHSGEQRGLCVEFELFVTNGDVATYQPKLDTRLQEIDQISETSTIGSREHTLSLRLKIFHFLMSLLL